MQHYEIQEAIHGSGLRFSPPSAWIFPDLRQFSPSYLLYQSIIALCFPDEYLVVVISSEEFRKERHDR